MPTLVQAEITPSKGEYDPRVRVVDYNPFDVVKLVTFYGVTTDVQFSEEEEIIDVAPGDDQAWKMPVSKIKNGFYIKPIADHADTNLTIRTNKRIYHFVLVVHQRPINDSTAWADKNLIFSLTFRYPEDEASKHDANAEKEALKARMESVKTTPKASDNFDYWVAGSEEISPTSAHDDGRFIYLTFSNNRDIPAVFSVDAEDRESLINTSVTEGNTIVVQRLVNRLVLRKGNSVASVLNKSFNLNAGTDNTNGTVVQDVKRIIKDGAL